MGGVVLVGAGPGDPGLITVRGLAALRRADVLVYDRLVSPALVARAPRRARRFFVGKAAGRQGVRQEDIHALLVAQARRGRRVVRLKGGDPFVFGRGGEEALALARAGVPVEVVPGVTSAVGVPARAGIPLTHRGLASSFAVVTGHAAPATGRIAADWSRLARGADTLVILMVGRTLAATARALMAHGREPETPVALIGAGTTPEQRVLVGTLADIAGRAAASPLPPPVLAVVGETVRLSPLAARTGRGACAAPGAAPLRGPAGGTARRRSA